jgi:hypothetical protein
VFYAIGAGWFRGDTRQRMDGKWCGCNVLCGMNKDFCLACVSASLIGSLEYGRRNLHGMIYGDIYIYLNLDMVPRK